MSFTEDTNQWAFHKQYHNVPIREVEHLEPVEEWPPISINKLNDIALLIKSLTYGELIGLAKELVRFGPITDATLPDVLWNWSRTHGR